jgi:hypothetical protein
MRRHGGELRHGLVLAAILAALSFLPAPARAQANPQLRQGIRLLTEAENAKAIRVLKRALTWRKNTTNDSATIHIYLGIAHFNLMQNRAAKASFLKALELDPEVQLPPMTSPKTEEFFNTLRPKPTPKASPGQLSYDPSSPRAPEVIVPSPPPRALTRVDSPRPPRSRTHWPAWTVAGVAAAAATAGIVLAALTVVENNGVNDLSQTSKAADDHRDAAARNALGANICFGLAGAAAITSGVLFYLGWRKSKDGTANHAAAAIVPVDAGAILHVGNIRW